MSESWWEYVQRVSGHALQTEIADRVEINQGTVSRWKSGESVRPISVAAFARAYDRPVLEAFVAAGFLTTADISAQPRTLEPDWDLVEEQAQKAFMGNPTVVDYNDFEAGFKAGYLACRRQA